MQRLIQLLVVLLLAGFSSTLLAGEKPIIFVSILPQKFFVEQLAKDLVDVEVMVLPGASPATYEPKVSQMKKLSRSEVYFAIGVPFEHAWLARIAGVNPQMRIVHTDAGIVKREMAAHHHDDDHGDGHGAEAGHHDEADTDHMDEKSLDPHIWLSPTLVKQQVEVIAATLKELFPEESSALEEKKNGFLGRIDQLNAELHEILQGETGTRFMVFHPTWGYFAHDFQLQQVPIEVEGKGPKSSQLRELIGVAQANDIKVIFAQPQFSRKSAQLIAREIGGQVLTLDPLAEDWLNNMKTVAETFRDTL